MQAMQINTTGNAGTDDVEVRGVLAAAVGLCSALVATIGIAYWAMGTVCRCIDASALQLPLH